MSDRTVLDEITEALERATPGEWELWTGCSWRRFGIKGRQGHPAVLEPTTHRIDGWPDLICKWEDIERLLLSVNLAPALVAVARAAVALPQRPPDCCMWCGAIPEIEKHSQDCEWSRLRKTLRALDPRILGEGEES